MDEKKKLKQFVEREEGIKGKPGEVAFVLACTGKIEELLVPESRPYRIVVKGAKAADGDKGAGGRGAVIEATFDLAKGDKLAVLCGQMSSKSTRGDSGGGGGTFVALNGRANPLIVAGGGGGTSGDGANGLDASLNAEGSNGDPFPTAGVGGKAGAGGRFGLLSTGGGGGGFNGDGVADSANPRINSPGQSFVNGGMGGLNGGFGGGGGTGNCGGGGGGGYSGGGGGHSGGGGGSFVAPSGTLVRKAASNAGHGQCVIYFA